MDGRRPDQLRPVRFQNGIAPHATGSTLDDVLAITAAQSQVVWSPRSNVVLYGSTAPVTMMDTLGVNIALGTDWMPTGSMNMLRELACAEYLDEERTQIKPGTGLGHWHPHELRHSAASLLLAQGVPLKVVSDLLGHSGITITANVYAHVLAPLKDEAAEAMNRALSG